MNEIDEPEFDVVIDTLQKKYDVLWKMNQRNMNSEFFSMGIMDDIRFAQMDELKEAITLWKTHNALHDARAIRDVYVAREQNRTLPVN